MQPHFFPPQHLLRHSSLYCCHHTPQHSDFGGYHRTPVRSLFIISASVPRHQHVNCLLRVDHALCATGPNHLAELQRIEARVDDGASKHVGGDGSDASRVLQQVAHLRVEVRVLRKLVENNVLGASQLEPGGESLATLINHKTGLGLVD